MSWLMVEKNFYLQILEIVCAVEDRPKEKLRQVKLDSFNETLSGGGELLDNVLPAQQPFESQPAVG